jgi:hypothetical protein
LIDFRQRSTTPRSSVSELYHENSKLYPQMLSELAASHADPGQVRREFVTGRATSTASTRSLEDWGLPAPLQALLQMIGAPDEIELFYAIEIRLLDGRHLGRYEPLGRRLQLIKDVSDEEIARLHRSLRLLNDAEASASDALLFVAGCFARNELLFGVHGYRRTLLEAGRVTQTIHERGRAAGLIVRARFEFVHRDVDAVLELDGTEIGAVVACELQEVADASQG